ncbi:MAG TPA: branched-chain amino acid ABC transporter permease [Candidatus Sulfotelmatobacter sp.]|nr:branched-chain amino acid ABC transporter permease [Candidatus Sulfotelmatobacter sp.]
MMATLRAWPFWACAAGLALLPLISGPFYTYLWVTCLIFGILAMGLDILMGYTGQVSFGHAAFFGLGAYSTAVMIQFYKIQSLWVSLLVMAVVVGAYALIVSYFATTRRGIYFALLTLIFAEVVHRIFFYTYAFGASDGIQGLDPVTILPGVPVDTPTKIYYVVLAALLVCYLAASVLVRSHFGRVLAAIRENEDRARFLGYNVRRYKMVACVVSALIAGVAGALYPARAGFATPDLLMWTLSGEAIVMVMLGGAGTLVGPILGGAFFTILVEKVSSVWDYYFIAVGLVLAAVVLFMPKGLFGLVARWTRRREAPGAAGIRVPAGAAAEVRRDPAARAGRRT